MKKTPYILLFGLLIGLVLGFLIGNIKKSTEDTASSIQDEEMDLKESGLAEPDGTYFAFFTGADKRDGSLHLVMDYASYGNCSESPEKYPDCPNGYYISNQNPKLRSIKLASNPRIIMQTYSWKADGNFDSDQEISVSQFIDPSKDIIRKLPYWITVRNGEIIEIREQFIP